MIKKYIQKILAYWGYKIINKRETNRTSLEGALKNINKFWQPNIIIDVGAAFGSWSEECYNTFPKGKYILIEPLYEYAPALQKIKNKIKNIETIQVAASSFVGEIYLNVHEDLVGSSLKNEIEGKGVDGKQRLVKTITLDKIAKKNNLTGSLLIKIDVQGSELDVLKGAQNILPNTECIILEVSLFKSFIQGPNIYDVISFMHKKGFVAYDIFGFLYRPYDNALSQVDIIFVKETGLFKKFQGYATKEQRENQNKNFKEKLNKLINA